MVRALKLLVLTVLAFAAAGCGSGDDVAGEGAGTGPSAVRTSATPTLAAVPLPACTQVWRVGRELPEDYAGCRENGVRLTRHLDCESGQQLFVQGRRLFAIPGGRIFAASGVLADDPQFQRMHRACTA